MLGTINSVPGLFQRQRKQSRVAMDEGEMSTLLAPIGIGVGNGQGIREFPETVKWLAPQPVR